jgi:hypothetical protein
MGRNTLVLAGFIILKFILQYILISPVYELHRDEFLYLDQANHLSWGYLSVPPVSSWISLIIKILGSGVFWVKFFPALFGALTIVMVWKTIEELRGNLFALCLGATGVLFSALLRLNTLYQPNSLDILCWTALYFAVIKYINTEKLKWLFIGACIFAIGFLNKYNIAFLIIGLLPALFLSRHRRLLLNSQVILPLLLVLVLILPNLIWQYQNQFPVFYHLKQLSEIQLIHVSRIGFLTSQLLFFTGALLLIFSALYAFWFYEPFQKYRFFYWSFLFTLLVFLYFRAKDYYAIGLYPIYIAFGAVYLSESLSQGWKRWFKPVLIALPLLFFLLMYRVVFPNKSPEYIVENENRYKAIGLLRWEDGKDHAIPQDFADMLGWKELAAKVDLAYAAMPQPEHTLILCDNYGQAGAINYYTQKGIRAVSFNADYIEWINLEPDYRHVIRIKNQRETQKEFEEISPYFESAQIAGSITNPFAREYGTSILVFTGSYVNINEIVKAEIDEVKNRRLAPGR